MSSMVQVTKHFTLALNVTCFGEHFYCRLSLKTKSLMTNLNYLDRTVPLREDSVRSVTESMMVPFYLDSK